MSVKWVAMLNLTLSYIFVIYRHSRGGLPAPAPRVDRTRLFLRNTPPGKATRSFTHEITEVVKCGPFTSCWTQTKMAESGKAGGIPSFSPSSVSIFTCTGGLNRYFPWCSGSVSAWPSSASVSWLHGDLGLGAGGVLWDTERGTF